MKFDSEVDPPTAALDQSEASLQTVGQSEPPTQMLSQSEALAETANQSEDSPSGKENIDVSKQDTDKSVYHGLLSKLGGLTPAVLQTLSATELDHLQNSLTAKLSQVWFTVERKRNNNNSDLFWIVFQIFCIYVLQKIILQNVLIFVLYHVYIALLFYTLL